MNETIKYIEGLDNIVNENTLLSSTLFSNNKENTFNPEDILKIYNTSIKELTNLEKKINGAKEELIRKFSVVSFNEERDLFNLVQHLGRLLRMCQAYAHDFATSVEYLSDCYNSLKSKSSEKFQ